MTTPEAMAALARFEGTLCRRWNRIRNPQTLKSLVLISRASDGAFWVAIALLLPLVYGAGDWVVVGRIGLAFAFCYPAYRLLKQRLARPRPCVVEPGVVAWTAPLDQYAFPSGHTMHSVAFSIVLCRAHPELTWLLVPFSVLVALSRIALGLHYPSDVAAGAALGVAAGLLVSSLPL